MNQYTFNISLSVLNHLGRNLYRSFITVLGEAISNSWDAEADNVWIYLNREENYLVIKDDGNGMDEDAFQNKFLKIGYSKRKDGETTSPNKNRPFIGRKGIGKLALLSCAERISIISKTNTTEFTGGIIDNSGLDQAIENDLIPEQYPLEEVDFSIFDQYSKNLNRGTIIYFDQFEDGIKNTEQYLKKIIALYFRFSLIDADFNIHFNGGPITIENLQSLADSTQFLWKINQSTDPFVTEKLLPNSHLKQSKKVDSQVIKSGFIGSVLTPSNLKIFTTKELVGIDLFVNGRLREKDILKHIATAALPERYFYGQIHCDFMDDNKDRFTSSREGVKSDDDKFKAVLDELKSIVTKARDDWDRWRVELRQDGDSENPRIIKKERKSRELFNTLADDYLPQKSSNNYGKVEEWIDRLANDAQFNFSSYGECFISENLLRTFITESGIELSPEALREINKFKDREANSKNAANLSIPLRQGDFELSYLDMDNLANLVDKPQYPNREAGIARDAKEYKPIRDALAHTALLTDLAKLRLTSTYENIKARIKKILEEGDAGTNNM